MIDKKTVNEIVHLCGADRKMLLVNSRYYCHFVGSRKEIEPDINYVFFSELYPSKNSPTLEQYADVYVLDVKLGKDNHSQGYGKLYRQVHLDLAEGGRDEFVLMLPDGTSTMVLKASILDVPYSFKKILKFAGFSDDYVKNISEPITSFDGVSSADLGNYNGSIANAEYYIDGRLYFETVDFSAVQDGGIVRLDSPIRTVVIGMQSVTKDNVQILADKIKCKLDELKNKCTNS